MLENVIAETSEISVDGDADTIVISRKEYNRLKQEREKYRRICLDFAESVPRFHEIAENIDEMLASKGRGL